MSGEEVDLFRGFPAMGTFFLIGHKSERLVLYQMCHKKEGGGEKQGERGERERREQSASEPSMWDQIPILGLAIPYSMSEFIKKQ